jgi:polyisoprenyl-phosphate glycosyltransferase
MPKYDAIDVVIPARNEDRNIGQVLSVVKLHPAIGTVIVVVDHMTGDNTAAIARECLDDTDLILTEHLMMGKGQCVKHGLRHVSTEHVMFCDADIKGLTVDHISALTLHAITDDHYAMTIGVPDIPTNYPTERIWAWPWVSGERCVPTSLVRPLWLHGYLMETQLNTAAKNSSLPLDFVWLTGMQAGYHMTSRRIDEMHRDAAFGREHGIL